MAAETARKFEALEDQAQKLLSTFVKAGHEAVSPAVIQPAGVFLDVIGEQLRARTYVFTDPDGDELCLRPDLTVPTCRLHLERHPGGAEPAKYCYSGTAFRFQPQDADATHPREFRQAGIEAFGGAAREQAEADTVALIAEALAAAGLKEWRLRTGDRGLFRAFLKSLDMPERWRQLLAHRFWQPEEFRAELARLVSGGAADMTGRPAELIASLDDRDLAGSEEKVAQYLEAQGIEHIGTRSLAEITENLLWIAADAKAPPLSAANAARIESYVRVRGPATDCVEQLAALDKGAGREFAAGLEAFRRRLALLKTEGIDPRRIDFGAEFGRSFEYYTGFVFEFVTHGLGPASPVAGGGRYDRLLKAVGAATDVPAVGAAIHTERLLAAASGAAP
jgi:ATP phosphoribosyltransferase regulatory subunit